MNASHEPFFQCFNRFAVTEFSSHVPGTFSWVERATAHQKTGVAFYRMLFGWDVNEPPIGSNEVYSLVLLRGKEVAAAASLPPDREEEPDDDDDDETPETPLDEPAPPPIQDPPDEPNKGPYTVDP
jgi:hypothetical protein